MNVKYCNEGEKWTSRVMVKKDYARTIVKDIQTPMDCFLYYGPTPFAKGTKFYGQISFFIIDVQIQNE
jgi:hypothetical protein